MARLKIGRCRRCKIKCDKTSILCTRCQTRCARCDKELTEDNAVKMTHGKRNRAHLKCKSCHNKFHHTDKAKDSRLVKTYGITLDEYNAIFKLQDGVCYICKKAPTGRPLHVDHKHVLKDKQQDPRDTRTRVRGLLCWGCNGAIAKFKDNPENLVRAAEYLKRWPAQEILKEPNE